MRILVTGASGYVGGFLIPQLLSDGHRVVAWGGPRWQPTLRHANLEAAASDLGGVTSPLADVGPLDAVVWLAQGPGYRDFPGQTLSLVSVNVLGLTRALDLGRRAGAKVFLFASTGNVYAPSLAPVAEDAPVEAADHYSWSKLSGEAIARLYQPWMAVKVLRIFGIYGPNQQDKLVPNLMARIIKGQPVQLEYEAPGRPDDGLLWTPCHVRDAVAVVNRLLERTGVSETLNLAGPETVSVAQVARLAAAELGREVTLEPAGRVRKRNLVADTSRLQAIMPEHRFVPFAEGLVETARVVRRQVAA